MKRHTRRSNRELARKWKRRLVLGFDCLEGRQLLSSTYTVINTNPTGAGSLFDAITQLNMSSATASSPNVIQFNISGGAAHTIALTQQLPDIIQPTDIQGFTQTNSSANTNPVTMGDNAVYTVIITGGGTVGNGLIFDTPAAGSSVEGLDLEGFNGVAITVNSDNTTVSGNFIGIGPDGVPTAATVNFDGVSVSGASGVTIGGTAAADRNVITGDTFEAVVLGPVGAVPSANDVVEGNFIGTEADLTLPTDPAVTNDFGVLIYPGSGDTVGGTAAGAGNVISANQTYGIGTQDALGLVIAGDIVQANGTVGVLLISSDGASITSSTIGGTSAGQGNPSYGIYLENTRNATIGGTAAGAGDLIAGNGANGLTVDDTSTGTYVAGSTITGNTDYGINFAGQAGSLLSGEVMINDVIQSNSVGGVLITDAPGTSITSSTIGGTTAAAGNLGFGISATGSANVTITSSTVNHNTADGIDFTNSPNAILTGDTVQTNGGLGILLTTSNGSSITSSTIGGTTAQGNGTGGISVAGSSFVTIGGTLAGAADTITGNTGIGIKFNSTSPGGLVVDSTISSNTGDGIDVTSAMSPTGGITGNTIDSNGGNGIFLNASSATGSVVHGNTIDSNAGAGVEISSSGNTIGGTTAGAGNIIASNQGAGVVLHNSGTPPVGNLISRNSIVSNGALGIDLSGTGVPLPNNSGNANNQGQNYPVITSVGVTTAGTTAKGTLQGANNANYTIELFSNTAADPSGYGEGQTYLTSTNVTTDAAGNATFSVSLGNSITLGEFISATATDSSNNTSEFSLDAVAMATTTTSVTSSVNPSIFGQSVTFAATVTAVSPGAGTPTGAVEFFDGATDLGTGTADGPGLWTFATSSLAVGAHAHITADYSGDANFLGSDSGDFSQTVNQATSLTTVSASSVNPSVFGQAVTFTATVTAVSPGAGTPTGTVEFFDGATDLGTGTAAGPGVWTFATSTLAVGSHANITADYSGDFDFLGGDSADFSQMVNQATSLTTVTASSVNPSVFGQSVTFTATVTAVSPGAGTPTGTVEFFDGATDLGTAIAVGPGVWTFATSTLAVGTHADITAEYSGEVDFLGGDSADFSQTVNQAASLTTVSASSPNPSVFGQAVVFTATVTAVAPGAGTPTGTVEFFDGATDLGIGTAAGPGVWTFVTSSLAVGTHADITADYSGDGNFLSGDSADFSQTVNQASSLTTVSASSVNPSMFGQAVTFTATVTAVSPGVGTPSGTVEFFDGATDLGTGTAAGPGVWTFATSTLAVGTHAGITADYSGAGNFLSGDSADFSQTVNQASSLTTVSASSVNPSVFGQAVTFTATVTAVSPGAGTPTGTVEFFDGATDLGTGIAAGPGVWTFATSSLAVGTHAGITADYSGDGNFLSGDSADFSQTVNQAASLTTVTDSSPNPSVFGQAVTFTATVTAVSPGVGTPTGTVTFFDGATEFGTATPSGPGVWTFGTSTLAVGTHADITADYSGDVDFLGGDSADFSQTVNQATSLTTVTASSVNPSVFGQSVTFTATVTAVSPGAGTPTGTVEFFDGATDLGTGTTAGSGVWTFVTSSLAVGTHPDITAVYSGDGNFLSGDSADFSQTVNQATSLTTVSASSVNPSVFGQSVTFTATVTAVSPGAGTPTGTVEFFDGATDLGTGTTAGSGVWTFATSTLAVGTHADITADYSGDGNFLSGDSADFSQTVNQATSLTTVTASSVNPSVFGQPVTFTATVTAVSPGVGTPSGTVEFFDGATDLGTGTASGPGVWTFATSSLAVGTHPDITADYSGDGNFLSGDSADFSQTVNQATSLTTVTASPNPSVSGQSVTFTATVTAASPGAGTPTGTVTFFDGATDLGTGTAAGPGVWTFATSRLATNASPGHAITAVYSGDGSFSAATSAPVTVVVNVAPTGASTITSSSPQIFYGQDVTLTATFGSTDSAAGPLTGTVAFYDGATLLGNAPLVGGASAVFGQASLATTQLGVGSHSITAFYSGDANHAPAVTQNPVSIEVLAATTTTTLSGATTAASTTLTANVVVTSPGSPPVVGMVTFYDGFTLLGTEPVVNGVATLSVTGLSAGVHNFGAVFIGIGTFSTSQASVEFSTANPTVTKVARYGILSQPSYLLLKFSTPLDPASAENLSNYSLVGPINHRGIFSRTVPIKSAFYDPTTQTVTLSLVGPWRLSARWQLTINGTSPSGVKAPSGAMLDGAARGRSPNFTTAGSNYVDTISLKSLAGRASKLPTLGLLKSVSEARTRAHVAAVVVRRHTRRG